MLTIDQILNDFEQDNSSVEKTASAPTSSSNLDEEVARLAVLLKEASVPEGNNDAPVNLHEKLAEIQILNSTIAFMEEEGVKLASFRERALSAGHNPEEVDSFIEKQAKAKFLQKMLGSNTAKLTAMGMAGMGLAGGAGSLGYKKGKKKGTEKTKEVGRAAFRAGRIYQHAQNTAQQRRLYEFLKDRQESQGKK